MKFIIDQQLPRALVRWFDARGQDAVHVADHLGEGSVDPEIWDEARRDTFVIITKDRDFANMMSTRRNAPQVVWLRLGNQGNRALMAERDRRWDELEARLRGGEMLIEVRPD